MTRLESTDIGPGDLVAAALPPDEGWLDLVREVWDAGAALFPVDPRQPAAETSALLDAALPTIVLGPETLERRRDGVRADEGIVLVVPTSGTGGRPKLVQFDGPALEAAVSASAAALEARPEDRWLCCLPLAHIGGLLVLLRAVLLGVPVSIHRRFDPEAVARASGAAFTSVVPTMLARLLDAGVDLASFRSILVGGARLRPEVRARAEAAGARVVETYGLTESCGGVVYEGRPLPGVAMRLGEDDGIELGGPTLMRGYRADPEATRRAFTPDGWLRTGDEGEIGPEGRLSTLGRTDDRINTGGEKVWPDEVQTALREHPKVAEVAVAGRPDRRWGERVVAWVVPVEPGDPPALAELRDFASSHLARYKAPRELILVERLPRTASGKLRRSDLPLRGRVEE